MKNNGLKSSSYPSGLKASRDALVSLKSDLKHDRNAVFRLLKEARILTKSGKVNSVYSSCR